MVETGDREQGYMYTAGKGRGRGWHGDKTCTQTDPVVLLPRGWGWGYSMDVILGLSSIENCICHVCTFWKD